ncbi:MAG TPA: 16S rRNA (adenine(1518)-N(6)/adenine(1519)-N(6))-dimethyltransferase RsmA [Candidatus Paceibacterota bacterium]
MRAKKSLGQNFLTSRSAAQKLVSSCEVTGHDVVVEVGPGKGMITEFLLARAEKVIAVEKDERMVTFLKERFAKEIEEKKLLVVSEDILEFKPKDWKLREGGWKLIGAIPYYITGTFLRTFLTMPEQPTSIGLIIQKEVADRIMARDKKENLLSLSVKAYGTPRYIEKVGRKNFNPSPNVDSAIIIVEQISRTFFMNVSEIHFWNIVHVGFAHKRKRLMKNLALGKLATTTVLEKTFSVCGISKDARAENLSLAEWSCFLKK